MKRKLLAIIILVLLFCFSQCELDSFLFNEQQLKVYTLPGNTIPDSLIEQVTMDSEGYTLYGFWVKSNGEHPEITILYCHGNKHHIDEYWDRVIYLHDLGFNIFIYDYRGYGMSEGESSEEGMYADADAALKYVLSRDEVNPEYLCLYGYSLGNVASIYLAAEKIDPLCLIAESPFASANSLTQGSSVLDIPAQWLTKGKFDNAEKIKKIKTPLLLIHGDADDFVRYRDNGKVIYENAPEPKFMVVVNDAGHSNIPKVMGLDKYLEIVQDWINTSMSF